MSRYVSKRISFLLIPLVGLVLVVASYKVVQRNAEVTETVMEFDDVAGQHIDVTYTNTDFLAKEESVSVYATKRDNTMSWLRNKLSKRILLFRYDPFSVESPYPSVTASGSDHIIIAIPEVSSVNCQRKQMETISIQYQIGTVEYPSSFEECK